MSESTHLVEGGAISIGERLKLLVEKGEILGGFRSFLLSGAVGGRVTVVLERQVRTRSFPRMVV